MKPYLDCRKDYIDRDTRSARLVFDYPWPKQEISMFKRCYRMIKSFFKRRVVVEKLEQAHSVAVQIKEMERTGHFNKIWLATKTIQSALPDWTSNSKRERIVWRKGAWR